jgi:hypothetical protein
VGRLSFTFSFFTDRIHYKECWYLSQEQSSQDPNGIVKRPSAHVFPFFQALKNFADYREIWNYYAVGRYRVAFCPFSYRHKSVADTQTCVVGVSGAPPISTALNDAEY